MTLKDSILRSLQEIGGLTNYQIVCQHIVNNNYYDFGGALTPASTVSALLGNFIREGDIRVKRIKQKGGVYSYYLAKNETLIQQSQLEGETVTTEKVNAKKTYTERSLHKLLASYLKYSGVYTKTIFHEQSNAKDNNQVWTHPDMVGIDFLKLKSPHGQNLLKSINKADTFKLRAYELKREINSDNDLKKAYFQAVSNSSWANYGYLVAFEFGDSLHNEINRLNQSFGIGVIELNANPYLSRILYPARYKEIDFKTLDKLCEMNAEFGKFIEHVERFLSVDDRYYSATEKEFDSYCDSVFENDTEVEEYCIENKILFENDVL